MSKGEKIAILAGNAGIIATTLAALAYIVGIIPINNAGHFWTHYLFVNVFSLLFYFVSTAAIGIALRRRLKRRHTKKPGFLGLDDFNTFTAILILALWIPVFILWLFIAYEIAYPPGTKSTTHEGLGLAFYSLPVIGFAIIGFCYIVDELFNPEP